MNKREFLKAGGAAAVGAALVRPALAVGWRRIAIVQPSLPGAGAFAARERSAGADVLAVRGDPVRWFRATLRPALAGAQVTAFTDATHALLLEGSLREARYVRVGQSRAAGRAVLWSASPRG